jgi:hypothetical protein
VNTLCKPVSAPVTVETKCDPPKTDSTPVAKCPVIKTDCRNDGGNGPKNPTPEPASYALFGGGAVVFGAFRKFRKKS